jgi:VanZ family protein
MTIFRRVLLIVLALYWPAILILTHIPRLPPLVRNVKDKTAHYVAYGLLTGLLFLTIWAFKPKWRATPLLVLLIVPAYGVIDELTQPWFGRSCDVADWIADTAAVITALVILTPIHAALRKRPAPAQQFANTLPTP